MSEPTDRSGIERSGTAALTGLRAVGALEAIAGAGLLLAPTAAPRVAAGASPPPPRWIVRVLGLRMAAQGLTLVARPTALIGLAGAAADVAHAASMVPVGRWLPRYRRPALVSGALAAGFATALAACVDTDEGVLVLRARLAALRRPAADPTPLR